MKEITIDLMHDYSYLSSLQLTDDESKAIFVETKVKDDKSDYRQCLYKIDTSDHHVSLIKSYDHKVRVKVVNDKLYELTHNKDKKTVHTKICELDFNNGEVLNEFELPLSVSQFKDVNDDYYLMQASITLNYPDYHHKSYDEQLKIEESE